MQRCVVDGCVEEPGLRHFVRTCLFAQSSPPPPPPRVCLVSAFYFVL
jgi:hypothetical protein